LVAVVAEDPADHALDRDATTEHCGDDQGSKPL
jgi:hypothetical protein